MSDNEQQVALHCCAMLSASVVNLQQEITFSCQVTNGNYYGMHIT